MDKKTTVVVVLGGIGLGGAGMIFNQMVKHPADKPSEAHQAQTQNFAAAPAPAAPLVEEAPPPPEGPSQDELDEQTIRAIYALRDKAAGVCKVPGISDAGLSAQLAVSLFQNESGLMQRELKAHDLAQLGADDDLSLGNATVGDKDLWTFLQDNKIIPVVEYTNNSALGAAFVNTGGQKVLVFYASSEKNTDGDTGTSFNLSGGVDPLLEALGADGALKQTGSILLYLDDSRLGDPEWKLHTFKSGEKSFEMIEGVKQTFMPAPHNPCSPAAP